MDYEQLSTVGCRQTEALRVCSHQANAHELHIVNGSLGAYHALWEHGIRCFDIDFMRTREGFVVATHPQRLQDAIGTAIGDVRKTLSNNTIIMIRSLGAADEEFPITDAVREQLVHMMVQHISHHLFAQLFELFSKLIKNTRDKPWLESKTQPNYRRYDTRASVVRRWLCIGCASVVVHRWLCAGGCASVVVHQLCIVGCASVSHPFWHAQRANDGA